MYQIPNDMRLSKNFMLSEFVCKDGSNKVIVDYELIDGLQLLRDTLAKPITITPNGGYRSEEWNKKMGGIEDSEHTKGKAGDCKVSGMTPFDVAYAADKLKKFKGIGVYTTFTHLDVGDYKGYWYQNAAGRKSFYNSLEELRKAVFR